MSEIALVIPTLGHGGAERVMSELANEWAAKGHNVHLILLANQPEFYSVNNNVVIHYIGFNSKGGLKKVWAEMMVFCKLRKAIIRAKPDFVLSFMVKYNILTILATRFTNIRTFVSDRSNPRKSVPFYLAILRKLTYRYATGIIAQTELAKKLILSSIPNSNVKVIPNPVKKIKQDRRTERENIILNVGRMIETKGHEDLLLAFSKLKLPIWKLVILGDGPLRNHLVSVVNRLGIDDKVFFPGVVKNVDEWLLKASIFAFPSYSEGFPNALAEALAAGLPCVSFNCDAGPADLITDGLNGYLVDVGDIGGMTNRLNKLLVDSNLRAKMGQKAMLVADVLNKERIANSFLNFCLP